MIELCMCALVGPWKHLWVCMCDHDGVPPCGECVWEDTMHGSFAAIVGVDKCSGLIELDYEYAMMRELCMYACVGLCITCCCILCDGSRWRYCTAGGRYLTCLE